MHEHTGRTFARDRLIPVLFDLAARLDTRRHELASAVREFTVRLQDAAGDPTPARTRAALCWLRPLCVCVRSLRLGNDADRQMWEEVKDLAEEAARLADLPFSAAS